MQEIKRNLQSNKNFESIINSPLDSREGSNHEYTKRKATGTKTQQSHLLHSLQQTNTTNKVSTREERYMNTYTCTRVYICVSLKYSYVKNSRTSPTVAPLALLRKDTRLSAGCETIAQNTPATYPPAKLTPSCKVLLHWSFGVGMACLYSISTIVSKDANFIMVSAEHPRWSSETS